MTLQKSLSFALLALAAILIAAAPANAQQMVKGSFNLPFEAQIGTTIVEPGQYDITLEESLGQKLVRLHAVNGSGDMTFLSGPSNRIEQRDNSVLKFVNVDGVERLKAFESGTLGQSFTFPLWKVKGDRSAHVGAETSLLVASR